ncbi:flagellar hook-length control protein FliK [Bacillus sp. FSL W8-0102]|uniref:flagellar hook-length control protein FliK n=1 Tax=Bacillus sp. FSL W8-0102 TaxID=2978205 RepID=UPI0030FAB946
MNAGMKQMPLLGSMIPFSSKNGASLNAGMMKMPLLGAIQSTAALELPDFQMAEGAPFAALFSQVMEESGKGSKSVTTSQQNNASSQDWIARVMQILEGSQGSGEGLEKPSIEWQGESLKDLVLPSELLQKAQAVVSDALHKWLGSGAPDIEQNDSKIQKDSVEQLIAVLEGLVALPIDQWKKLDPNVMVPLFAAAKQLTNLDSKAQLSPNVSESVHWIQKLLSEISQKAETETVEADNQQLAILKKAYSHYVQPQTQTTDGEKELSGLESVAKWGESAKEIQPLNEHEASFNSSLQSNTAKAGETISVPLQSNPKLMNLQQFIDKFRQILEKSQFAKQPNANTLMIKLYPENLGTLRIELQQKDGVVTARILASAQTVKELIDSNIASLKQAFTQQNISVDKVEIVFHPPELDTYHRDSSEGGRQEQRQQPQKQKDDEKESDRSFEELLINMEV